MEIIITDLTRFHKECLTQELIEHSLTRWTDQLSTSGNRVKSTFIEVEINEPSLQEPIRRRLNRIPTSFSLSDEEVDSHIETGRRLLRNDPAYQRLLVELEI